MLDGEDQTQALDAVRRRLEADGVLSPTDWDRAVRATGDVGERVDRVLAKLGLASEERIVDALAEALGLERLSAADAPDAPYPLGAVAPRFLKANKVAPLQCAPDGGLRVAVADPFDSFAIEALSKALDRAVAPVLALEAEIDALIAALYDASAEGAPVASAAEDDVERLRDLASEAPIIRLVNELIEAAVRAGASDLHIERGATNLRVRRRIDGLLQEERTLPAEQGQAIISRIKIMARLDIGERRLPQDGRIKTTSGGREIDLRVSTLPSLDGEAAALRILDRAAQPTALDALGLDPASAQRLETMLSRPNGVILATGPTGSGKTTTLYAALRAIATPERKCLTVEDPVEYRLPNAVQVQVKPETGLDFAAALRAFLRHDPDIVMIGEVRDRETAKIAAQAALTGHLVLSTLHTNSAAASIGRLLDMGVEDYLLGSVLVGALAQRLVRRLCPDCKTVDDAPPIGPVADAIAETAGDAAPPLWRAVGCAACGGTGYRGRRPIVEALLVDDAIRAAIRRRATAQDIEHLALAGGMRRLWRAGLDLALAGETTLEEILRAAQEA